MFIQNLTTEEVRGLVAWHTLQHHMNIVAKQFELAEWNNTRAMELILLLQKDKK